MNKLMELEESILQDDRKLTFSEIIGRKIQIKISDKLYTINGKVALDLVYKIASYFSKEENPIHFSNFNLLEEILSIMLKDEKIIFPFSFEKSLILGFIKLLMTGFNLFTNEEIDSIIKNIRDYINIRVPDSKRFDSNKNNTLNMHVFELENQKKYSHICKNEDMLVLYEFDKDKYDNDMKDSLNNFFSSLPLGTDVSLDKTKFKI